MARHGLAYLFISHDLGVVRVDHRPGDGDAGRRDRRDRADRGGVRARRSTPIPARCSRRRRCWTPTEACAMMRPGPRNLITDVPGLLVGNATRRAAEVGRHGADRASAVRRRGRRARRRAGHAGDRPARPRGGWSPAVDALVLSGGSAFGLDAASGVVDRLRALGRGFRGRAGGAVPIVPAAILFDLANGGEKDWDDEPLSGAGRGGVRRGGPRISRSARKARAPGR